LIRIGPEKVSEICAQAIGRLGAKKVIAGWSLVAGRWSLVAGRWSLVAGRWSLEIQIRTGYDVNQIV
jgi:hypothetical protein